MKRRLNNPIDVHWWTTEDGREYLKRLAFDEGVSFTEMERQRWFTIGWEDRLLALRKKHRRVNISDNHFK
jgi:hypothetical protein